MDTFRLEVGRQHEVTTGNIVGAIANEIEIDAQYIGHIDIREEYSTVELPTGMPDETFEHLKKVWVCGRPLSISHIGRSAGNAIKPSRARKKKPAAGKAKKARSKKDKSKQGKPTKDKRER